MLNILIVEDDVIQSKQLINYISKTVDNVKIYGVAYTCEEAIEMIKSNNVDLILLDLNLPDKSGIELIKYIEKNNLKRYKDSILIISGEYNLFPHISNSYYVFSFVFKPYEYEKVSNEVRIMADNKIRKLVDNCINSKIKNELETLNYNFSYNGTRYLAEIIFEISNNINNNIDNLSKDVYPIISKRHGKSINTIAGNIKQATKFMIIDNKEENLIEYFKYSYFKKPTVKEIIFTILNKVEQDYHDNLY